MLLHVAPGLAEEPTSTASTSGESDARRRAAELFARGRAAFERGDYEAALVDLRTSYELVPAPALLFNIAQALRLAGKCEEAAEQYRRYRDAGLELPSDFDELDDQARRCADEQRASKAQQSEPAAVAPQGAEAAGAPSQSAASPSVAPPPQSDVNREIRSTAPREAVAPAATQPDEGAYKRPVGIACFAVAAGGVILGTLFVVRAQEAEAEMESRSRTDTTWNAEGADVQAEGQRSAYWAAGLYAASTVAAGAGLWLLLSAPSNEASQVAVGVAPSAVGVATSVRASF